jgi:hypothetical protein
MAQADECENISICSREAPQQQLELEDLSVILEAEAGPVEVGPPVITGSLTPCDISYLQFNFKPLINTNTLGAAPGAAPDAAPGAAPGAVAVAAVAAPGAAPNAPDYAVHAMNLQTYAKSAIEHIIQARNSAVDNARIANTYHLCGEAIRLAIEAVKALGAMTSTSDSVAENAYYAAAHATDVVNRASTTFKPFYDYAVANPSVGEATVNGGIEAVRIEATRSLAEVVARADNAFDIAKQNNNPDYYYAASAASAAVAAVAIIAGNIEVYNIYYERAISAFSNGTNPVTNSDEVLSNTVNDPTNARATTGTDPLTYCFGIMDFIEQGIKQTLLAKYLELFETLGGILSTNVPNLPSAIYKGFVGITKCGFLSKYTTVIYYAGYIPYNQKDIIASYMTECHRQINAIVAAWPVADRNFTLTCKLETSNLQYDTQKIILCINCGGSHNIIQIPILNVVGFPVFQDVNPLLGLVTHPSLPCFFTPRDYYFYLDIIRKFPDEFAQFIATNTLARGIPLAFAQAYPTESTEFNRLHPETQSNPFPFMLTFPDQLAKFIASHTDEPRLFSALIPSLSADILSRKNINLQTLSLLDIIVRVRICANQGAITALSEPSKEEVMLIRSCFQGVIPQDVLRALIAGDMNASAAAATAIAVPIHTITQAMRKILYTEANIKPFSLFCNIFYNFINVSLGFRSLAKIIYSEFFGASDNYGKVIRACQVVNSLPTMRENVKFFLTGSNAARVYVALNEIIKFGTTEPRKSITPETIATIETILKKTFGNLSDNDFMIYLKGQIPRRLPSPWVIDSFDPERDVLLYKNPETNEVKTLPEEENPDNYRVFIRMIMGGSFYFFKNLFDDTTTRQFTLEMIQSVGIVGFMDHLFAQRFDARKEFLRICYEKDTTSFLANMLRLGHMQYFDELDKQINVAHLDGVFKYYNLVTFYARMFHICSVAGLTSIQLEIMYDFLINKATSIDCIATVWTLVLNVLYTLFVPENCLARIAVGKFDNDPKNLKLYMGILTDHLDGLTSLGYNHPNIPELRVLQTSIVDLCETSITTGAGLQPNFKQTCDMWVQKMVAMAVSGPEGQGLFMLSVSDALEIRGPLLQKELCSTNLERALCLAYLPTVEGNICSAASPPGLHIFIEKISSVIAGKALYEIRSDVTTRSSQFIDENEVKLRITLSHLGQLMFTCLQTSTASPIVPTPPIPGQQRGAQLPLSTYLNFMWKHLTTSAIDLKIFFKENLTDIKRVTGIKYIALVLGGYFQIRLLVDDVSGQCRVDKRAELESFKTSQEMIACKRGLLPLLIAPTLVELIKALIQLDITHTGTNYDDPIPRILKILGFLFSIKVKSSSPHSPYQLLRLEDSILSYPSHRSSSTEILNPTRGMFIGFLTALDVNVTNRAIMKCICRNKGQVEGIDIEIYNAVSSNHFLQEQQVYDAVGGSNDSESNSGRNSVSSLNKYKHKYKHNKLARNNRTHRNKNKRKKNSKSKSHKPKPKSKSKSKSGKSRRKNVTFKRRKRSNKH